MTKDPVVVVGGSLAGIAAAARLAKVGHRVVLLESGDRLGGRWALRDSPQGQVDPLPAAFSFPAPWRDLFKKSGRAFDAELARAGLALIQAAPTRHQFADGSSLVLPAERGAQWASLSAAYGEPVAARWRDLLDRLDRQWQVLRGLGVESEAPRAGLTAIGRARLQARTSIADLAREVGHPHLARIIESVAIRIGSRPDTTPGWHAVRLVLERTFGRWQLTRAGAPIGTADLIALLEQRLAIRGVEVRLGTPVTHIGPYQVHLRGSKLAASAVVAATDPWTFVRLAGSDDRALRRRLRWAKPALAPHVTLDSETVVDDQAAEIVRHLPGGPVVEYRLPGNAGTRLIRHDHRAGVPDPSLGPQWRSWRTWRRLSPLRAETPMVFLASGGGRAGNDPWGCLLVGAQACYAVHDALTGEDIRPTNKALGRR